ncbi:MAG: hypothetical protein PWQ48_1444 [Thermotogaceae bacterium]|nr:hypothetical protein [Thermotogaceae bacterium]
MEFYTYVARVKKTGLLRFLSNMEYMRAVERTIRRAGFPVWFTQGFHPRIKLSFPVALSTGVVDLVGLFELRLAVELSTNDLKKLVERFNSNSPKGLIMTNIWKIEKNGLLIDMMKYYKFRIIVEKSCVKTSKVSSDFPVESLEFIRLNDFVVVEYIIAKDKITNPEKILNNLVEDLKDEIFYIPICYKAFDKDFNDIIQILEGGS